MLTEQQKALVKDSWEMVVPIADTAAALFYAKLFELDPSVKPLFKTDIKEQGAKLMKTLGIAVKSLDKLDTLVPVLQDLGRRHVAYGVTPAHYDTVAVALLDTLSKGLGDGFTDQVKEAWIEVYQLVSSTMIDASKSAPPIQARA